MFVQKIRLFLHSRMKLSEEIKKIDKYIGTDTGKFNNYYSYLVSEYPSEKEKKQIDDYIESSLYNLSMEIGSAVDEIGIKLQQMKTPETVQW